MPTATTDAATGQEPTATQPQVGAPQNTQQPQAGSADDAASTVDPVQLQRELAEARREAAKYRTDAKKLADEKKAADDAALPDKERFERKVTDLEKRNAELEQQLRSERVANIVVVEASKLGFADPADAARFIDSAGLEYDDAGKPKGITEQLRALIAQKPYLASAAARASGSADQGTRGTTPKANDMNSLLRTAAGRSPN